jgi:hypothetical protein
LKVLSLAPSILVMMTSFTRIFAAQLLHLPDRPTQWERTETGAQSKSCGNLVALSQIRHRLPRRLAARDGADFGLHTRRLQQDRRPSSASA